MYFNFIWNPEKMESISRKTLIAEKERGGFEIPDVESKIKACELEKILELKKNFDLKNPKHTYNSEYTFSKLNNPSLLYGVSVFKSYSP